MRVENPGGDRQDEQAVGGAHRDSGGHREAGIREIALLSESSDEAVEQDSQAELARSVRPETLTADAQAAGAKRVDQRDAKCPPLAHQLPQGSKEEHHGERRYDRCRELLETPRPAGLGWGTQQDGHRVDGHGQHAGAGGVG